MRCIGLLLVLSACPAPDTEAECEGPEFEDTIGVPQGCRPDPSCVGSPAQQACGTTYQCVVEGHRTCVTATDCDCMSAWADTCPGSAEVPAFCDYRGDD